MQSAQPTRGTLWHLLWHPPPSYFVQFSQYFSRMNPTACPPLCLDSPQFFPPLISKCVCGAHPTAYRCNCSPVSREKVTTRLLILIHPQSPRLPPHTVQTHPLLSAMTVLYNTRLYSLYLPFLALSLCIPASLPRYPSHTSPPANGSYGEKKKESRTVSNTSA